MHGGFSNTTTYPNNGSGAFNTAYAHPPFNLGPPPSHLEAQGYRSADMSATPPQYVQRDSDEGNAMRTGVNLTAPNPNLGMDSSYRGYMQDPTGGQPDAQVPPSWMPYGESHNTNNPTSSKIGPAFVPSVLAPSQTQDLNAMEPDYIDQYRKTITPTHPLFGSGLSESDFQQVRDLLNSGEGQIQAAMTPQTQNLMDTLFASMRPATPSDMGPSSAAKMSSGQREPEALQQDPTPTPSFDFSTLDPNMEAVTASIDVFDFNVPVQRAQQRSDDKQLQEKFQPSLPTDATMPDNSYAMYLPSGRIQNMGDASSASEFNLSTGWYDPLDLPQPARDELLRIFFDTATVYMLGMNLARFKTRLTLPANKRPHPCWLYGMYLFAARYSDDPAIRNLEGHFYEIANTQFEIAVQNADRLLDAIRGAHLVSVYCYSRGKYLQVCKRELDMRSS